MTDKILIELLELIGPGEDDPLVDVGKSVDTLLGEMDALQAEPTWLDYEKIIQDDLMKYIDNPSRPTAMEKMTMLDKLSGDISFYDKWLEQRNEDNLFYEEVINTQTEAMPMEKAQEVVEFLFQELEDGDEDEKLEFLEGFETNGSIADMARDSGTLPAEWDEFATMVEETVGEAVEMQEVNLSLSSLEMPYWAVDEGMQPISAQTLAADGELTFGGAVQDWALLPMLDELAMGAIGMGAGFLVTELFVQAFTPLVNNIIWIAQGHDPFKLGTMTDETAGIIQGQLDYVLGEEAQKEIKIMQYYQRHETYVWVFDDGTELEDEHLPMGYHMGVAFSSSNLPSTGLWIFGRVLVAEGRKVGYPDHSHELIIAIKPCATTTTHTIDDDNRIFWVDLRTARMVGNTSTNRLLCSSQNMNKLVFRRNVWDFDFPEAATGVDVVQEDYFSPEKLEEMNQMFSDPSPQNIPSMGITMDGEAIDATKEILETMGAIEVDMFHDPNNAFFKRQEKVGANYWDGDKWQVSHYDSMHNLIKVGETVEWLVRGQMKQAQIQKFIGDEGNTAGSSLMVNGDTHANNRVTKVVKISDAGAPTDQQLEDWNVTYDNTDAILPSPTASLSPTPAEQAAIDWTPDGWRLGKKGWTSPDLHYFLFENIDQAKERQEMLVGEPQHYDRYNQVLRVGQLVNNGFHSFGTIQYFIPFMPVGWTWTSNGQMWAPGQRHFGKDQLASAKKHYASEGGLNPEFQSAIRLRDMRSGGTLDIWETEAIAGVERFVPISQNPDLKNWLVMMADVPNDFGGTNDPKNRFWHYLSPDNLWFDPMDTDGLERHVAELKLLTPMEPPPPSKPEEVPPQTIVPPEAVYLPPVHEAFSESTTWGQRRALPEITQLIPEELGGLYVPVVPTPGDDESTDDEKDQPEDVQEFSVMLPAFLVLCGIVVAYSAS